MFEPSERLWRVWDLILNAISPLLPSCWGFSFALGHWISLQSHSSATQPPFPCLSSCWGFSALRVGYLLTVAPAPRSHNSRVCHLAGASLPLDVGYLLTVAPAPRSHHSRVCHLAGASLPLEWGTSSQSLQRHATAASEQCF